MPERSLAHLGMTSERQYERFIGGRKRYNSARQAAAHARQMKLLFLLTSGKFHAKQKNKLAAELGVHRSTVHRDLLALTTGDTGRCPTCGQLWPHIADELDK